jgi:hypothetical protein
MLPDGPCAERCVATLCAESVHLADDRYCRTCLLAPLLRRPWCEGATLRS